MVVTRAAGCGLRVAHVTQPWPITPSVLDVAHVDGRRPGRTSAEAGERLLHHGLNEVGHPARVGLTSREAAQLRDPLILVLLGTAVLTAATGDMADLTIVLLVVVVNTAVGVWQEVRADRAIDALTALATPMARVVRDGAEREVPTTELVPATRSCWARVTSSRPTARSWRQWRCASTSRHSPASRSLWTSCPTMTPSSRPERWAPAC
jgi:Cation transporter/ATPase, N-terminus